MIDSKVKFMPIKVDKKDWKILEALCTDARQSHNQIARQVGLSKNAVGYRIDRLLKKKIISGFVTPVNGVKLGIGLYTILLKTHGTDDQEAELVNYLTNHPLVEVFEPVLGGWDYILEMGCREVPEFCDFMNSIKRRFCKIIIKFEAHPILEQYKMEQLPVELQKPREVKPYEAETLVETDEIDRKLLNLLNEDATMMLHELAEKTGITSETVSARLRKLREKNVIIRHTAQVNIVKLGYEMYWIRLDLQNMSEERDSALRSYLLQQAQIRYAHSSAVAPSVFIFFGAKTPVELDKFLKEIKDLFFENVVHTEYLLSSGLFKYMLFPKGFV